MCGINGVLRAGASEQDLMHVSIMNAALAHRGPDDSGLLKFDFGAIGMQRLALVDIDNGHQPLRTHDGDWSIVFNGEIYNYLELREAFRRRGYRFSTESDTEVLLASIVLDGIESVGNLNGMFAFAAVDHRAGKAYLARDRWGIKPLFYYKSPAGSLYFSSEIRGLTSNPDVPRRIDRASLKTLLVDRFVADPWTLFEDVFQLQPDHLIEWSPENLIVRPFFRPVPEKFTGDEPEAIAELRSRLSASVRSQLIADVPVGVFLSGGIDSTTVAAFAAKEHSGPLKTFTVGFPSATHDETETAREVAHHLGTDHTEIQLGDVPYDPGLLKLVVRHVGQPLGDPSCIPTFLISAAAGQELKAILSGDGGDEFFGGYDYIRWAASVSRLSRIPYSESVSVALNLIDSMVPRRLGKLATTVRRYRRGAAIAAVPNDEQLRLVMSLWSPEEAAALMPDQSGLRSTFAQWYSHECDSVEEAFMRQLSRTSMSGAILTKVDRMSMANSLEVRVPLLDNRVTEFALSLPLRFKIQGHTGKNILRKVGRDLLPRTVFSKPKQGFALPLADWINETFWSQLHDFTRPGSILAELFEPGVLETCVFEARSVLQGGAGSKLSRANLACRMWVLAQIGVWHEEFSVT